MSAAGKAEGRDKSRPYTFLRPYMLLRRVGYRIGQVRQQLGKAHPLTGEDYEEVGRYLPASALPLFRSMSVADQQHSLRTCRGLLSRGCAEGDMLAAALLHDVGKAQGRVPFWTRPTIVLGKWLTPRLLARLTVYPGRGRACLGPELPRWRRSLSYAWWHAEVGAELAKDAGLPERAVLYIRTHHQPDGPAAALHAVDEES